jgi:L-threonylcarbamoyladenylate synthase
MNPLVEQILKEGGVGVIPTDTIYGVVGSALSKKTVTRIYRLRRRNRMKPMIILLSSQRDLRRFGVTVGAPTRKILKKLWPGKISIILPCVSKKFSYLHRGTETLAFRIPKNAGLRGLLRTTGPLVAPSANLEGRPPARTIGEAKKYFGNRVDFYMDVGPRFSKPSSLIKLHGNNFVVLR